MVAAAAGRVPDLTWLYVALVDGDRVTGVRLRDGSVDVLDVPPPGLTPDGVVVDVRASVLSVGTERSKGTKVFALAGKIRHTGLIEVPMK